MGVYWINLERSKERREKMIEVLKVKLQETKERMRSIEREIQALGIQMNPDDFEDYSKAIVFKEDEVSKMYKEFFKQI